MHRWQRFLAEQGCTFDEGARSARARVPEAQRAANGALVDLGDYDLLILEGKDAHTFLQGYLTCDVDLLRPDRALLGAFCNLQGRVLADVVLASIGGAAWLSLHRSLATPLKESLAKYLQFSRSKFRATEDSHVTLGLLAEVDDAPLPKNTLEIAPYLGGFAIRVPGDSPRWLVRLPFDAAQALWTSSASAGRIADASAWDLADIDARWARLTAETSATFLPQMLGLTDLSAVSFEKGCYLGQEIVARAEHLGQVKRRLERIAWRGDRTPSPGESMQDPRGRAVGVVIVAASTAAGSGEALAVVASGSIGATLSAPGITFAFE